MLVRPTPLARIIQHLFLDELENTIWLTWRVGIACSQSLFLFCLSEESSDADTHTDTSRCAEDPDYIAVAIKVLGLTRPHSPVSSCFKYICLSIDLSIYLSIYLYMDINQSTEDTCAFLLPRCWHPVFRDCLLVHSSGLHCATSSSLWLHVHFTGVVSTVLTSSISTEHFKTEPSSVSPLFAHGHLCCCCSWCLQSNVIYCSVVHNTTITSVLCWQVCLSLWIRLY